nr:MAG: ORF1 [TTV-like mini virus]
MARYYFRRYWKPRWRRTNRYRPFWTWRARAPLRRRRRRRRRRVRRKLPYLTLKQYQPKYINRLCIKGLFCLLQVHKVHYNHNFNQYANSITAEGLSNGGGFTIIRFTLNSLFELHEKARNYWTKSNKNMPLFRYTGCSIKVYRPLDIDLVVKFQTCYPMCCSKLMFTGCQPSMLMMARGSKKIRCKRNAPNAKPYRKFKFKPPDQMMNKWYFQHNESNTGLILIQAASASFDNYYTSSHSESSTVTLHGINTRIFQNLNFQTPDTHGYNPKLQWYLWTIGDHDNIGSLIYLGQSKKYNQGLQISTAKVENNYPETIKKYLSNPDYWGNPFHQYHINKQEEKYYYSTIPPLQLLTNTSYTLQTPLTNLTNLHEFTQEIVLKFRYNPFTDKGDNNIYILPNFTSNLVGNTYDLEPPDDIDLQNPGFPNWLGPFGFQDYLIKLGKKSRINKDYIAIIKTKYFYPQESYYILVDDYFLKGSSEELIGRTDWDNTNWFPQITHQQGALNTLALCGPGAPKLGDTKLAEAKIEYNFYFKVGGCAPPIEKIADPTTQPTYATPTNILNTNSLQSPEESIESFLYQFDWRRDQITETAAERITKDKPLKKYVFTDSTSSGTEVPLLQTHEKDLLSSEEEEAQKETLFEQLQRQRLKQKDLRHRIRHLLTQIQQLE